MSSSHSVGFAISAISCADSLEAPAVVTFEIFCVPTDERPLAPFALVPPRRNSIIFKNPVARLKKIANLCGPTQ